jgi:hypothetical protein
VIRHSGDRSQSEFSYELALGFWRRLLGLKVPIAANALLFPKCSCVHGLGLPETIQLAFLNKEGEVLMVRPGFGARSIAAHSGAAHILEFQLPQQLAPGDHVIFGHDDETSAKPWGFSVIEILIALPLLLLVLFALIQIGLLWHARFSLQHAVVVAARHASVSHGSDHSIRDGFVQGLMPLVGRSTSLSGMPTALFLSGSALAEGLAMGWMRWQVLSPTRQSFQDWGRPADPYLSPGGAAGEFEIPSAPLPALALRARPASGVKQTLGGLAVGVASNQTLIEANTLKLRLEFGVPLNMPIAGPLLAASLSLWSGCGWPDTAQRRKIGPVDYGYGASASPVSSSIQCRALASRDLEGRWKPRWPVRVYASVAMQSNARRSLMVLQDR